MSVLVPNSPSPKKHLPSKGLTSRDALLKKEYDLNEAEKATLTIQNQQLEDESKTLKRQIHVLKKNIKNEGDRMNKLIAEEEEKNKAALQKIQSNYENTIDSMKLQKTEGVYEVKSKVQSISSCTLELSSCIRHNQQSISEFIKESQKRLKEITNY